MGLTCCPHHGPALKARGRSAPSWGRETNTYGLPLGLALRRELAAAFREQLRAVRAWLDLPAKADLPAGRPPLGPGDAELAERSTPHLAQVWDDAGRKFLPTIGHRAEDWKVTDPHIREAIAQQALDFSRSTNATSLLGVAEARDATRDALARGMPKGEANRKLAKRINRIFSDPMRAARVAATEAARAHNAATMMSGERSGAVLGWKWLPASNACPVCLEIAASVNQVRAGQPFAVNFGSHPVYSTVPHPPAHPWCRCSMTPVIDPNFVGGPQPAFGTTMDGPPKFEEAPPPATPAPVPLGTPRIRGPFGPIDPEVVITAGKILGRGTAARDALRLVQYPGSLDAWVDVVGGNALSVLLKAPGILARRIISRDAAGLVVEENAYLRTLDTLRPIAGRFLARQMLSAARRGVARLEVTAASGQHAMDLARLGFDVPLKGVPLTAEAREALARDFPGVDTLTGLLLSRGGRDFWATHGRPARMAADPNHPQNPEIAGEYVNIKEGRLVGELGPGEPDPDGPELVARTPEAKAYGIDKDENFLDRAVGHEVSKEALYRAAEILGRDEVTAADLAGLAGAPDGAEVFVSLAGNGDVNITWRRGPDFAVHSLKAVAPGRVPRAGRRKGPDARGRRRTAGRAVLERRVYHVADRDIPLDAETARRIGESAEDWVIVKSRLGILPNVPEWANAASEQIVGYELKHYGWIDRRTGFKWDLFPTKVKGQDVPFSPLRVRIKDPQGEVIYDGSPEGAPAYNVLLSNCQDGYKFLDDLKLPEDVARRVRVRSTFADSAAVDFANQVAHARRLGVERIDAHTGRTPGKDERDRSYYHAALLGFDANLPKRIREQLPPELAYSQTLSDLMREPAGRRWWEEHGTPLDVKFSVKDDSPSVRQIRTYLRTRGVKTLSEPLARKALAAEPHALQEVPGAGERALDLGLSPGAVGVLAACWDDAGPAYEDLSFTDEDRQILDSLWDRAARTGS